MEEGFVLPDRFPVQELNVHPAFAVAVNCTTVPYAYVAWLGFLVTDPDPSSVTLRENSRSVTVPFVTVIGTYVVSLVTPTSESEIDETPDIMRAVNEMLTKLPGVITDPTPRINPYTSAIIPAVLLIVPSLKNVVYPVKIVPSETEFACNKVGLNKTFSSYDLMD
jgi:uncharacterized membrane protein